MFTAGCGDDEPDVHSTTQLLGALLTVDDVKFIPTASEENTRAVVEGPNLPADGNLDPYLCSEAGIPMILTLPQAQLELTGSSVMEILVASKDAKGMYRARRRLQGVRCRDFTRLPAARRCALGR
jgi:hypothetical protein